MRSTPNRFDLPLARFGMLSLCAAMLLTLSGCSGSEAPVVESDPDPGAALSASLDGEWPAWGGPGGDFQLAARNLADSWPESGPPLIWQRDFGPGYAAVAAAGDTLYSAYRDGDDDVIVALSAGDGATRWESRYTAPIAGDQIVTDFGLGPNATPLLLGDRIVTLGFGGQLRAWSRQDGSLLWKHDLVEELGGVVPKFGYAASPVLHDGAVLVLVGGERGLIALSPDDGSILWETPPSSVSYATPIAFDVDGLDQVVYMTSDEVVSVASGEGRVLWREPVENQYANNATDPLWSGDGKLWVATQLEGGARLLDLKRNGDGIEAEQVWFNGKVNLHYWNALRIDNHVYANIGGQGSILAGVSVDSGEILWRERGYEKSNLLHVGDRTILLDSKGHLAMVRFSPEGLNRMAEARITEEKTWTPPTLVDTRLFVRDGASLRAYELGKVGA